MSDWGDVANWSIVTFRECFIEDAARAIEKKINKNWYINEDTGRLDREELKESIAWECSDDFFWNCVAEDVSTACIYPRRCETIVKRLGYKDWETKYLDGESYQTDLYDEVDTVEKAAAQALYDYFIKNKRMLEDKIQNRAYKLIINDMRY